MQSARERGRSSSCKSNLKQLGTCFFLYAGDYDDWSVMGNAQYNGRWGVQSWTRRMIENKYLPGIANTFCPSDKLTDAREAYRRKTLGGDLSDTDHSVKYSVSYGLNIYSFGDCPGSANQPPVKLTRILNFKEHSPDLLLFTDANLWIAGHGGDVNETGGYGTVPRHQNRANLVAFGGHVTEMVSKLPYSDDDLVLTSIRSAWRSDTDILRRYADPYIKGNAGLKKCYW